MNAQREKTDMGARHIPLAIPDTAAELEDARVVERPDGIWLQYADGRELGPYASIVEAIEDQRARAGEDEIEPGESLEEAEAELGMSEWIDPDTESPAEDHVPRLEDH